MKSKVKNLKFFLITNFINSLIVLIFYQNTWVILINSGLTRGNTIFIL